MQPKPDLTAKEKLQVLEDVYADLLIADVDVKTLTMLWNQIKELRRDIAAQVITSQQSQNSSV